MLMAGSYEYTVSKIKNNAVERRNVCSIIFYIAMHSKEVVMLQVVFSRGVSIQLI